MTAVPSLAEFESAARSLVGVISHTPALPSRALSDVAGVPVVLKMENLQRTGSFKIRGATYRLAQLTDEERARGVVAAAADAVTGVEVRAALTDDDLAGAHLLAAEALDAESLCVGIAPVPRAGCALLVCHLVRSPT